MRFTPEQEEYVRKNVHKKTVKQMASKLKMSLSSFQRCLRAAGINPNDVEIPGYVRIRDIRAMSGAPLKVIQDAIRKQKVEVKRPKPNVTLVPEIWATKWADEYRARVEREHELRRGGYLTAEEFAAQLGISEYGLLRIISAKQKSPPADWSITAKALNSVRRWRGVRNRYLFHPWDADVAIRQIRAASGKPTGWKRIKQFENPSSVENLIDRGLIRVERRRLNGKIWRFVDPLEVQEAQKKEKQGH